MLSIVRFLLFLSLSFTMFSVFAENVSALVEQFVEDGQGKMGTYLQEAENLDQTARLMVKKILKEESLHDQNSGCGCQKTINTVAETKATSDVPKVLIFISFSMPKDSLRTLFQEAEQQGATLVMRGLKNNSFMETANIMRELEIAAQIDPDLFEKYQINTVPTFVLMSKEEPILLKGNVSLSYAQAKFQEALKAEL